MQKKPNLIFIITDQHRRSALSLWQKDAYKEYLLGEPDPVKTPNLDKLAEGGIILENAYSSYPVCSPFRAMLFSGKFPEDNGVWQNCAPGRSDELRDDVETLFDTLSDEGYSIGYVGKWHLEEPRADFDENGNYIGECDSYAGKRYFPDGSPDSNTACWDTLIRRARARKIDYLYAYNTWDIFRGKNESEVLRKPHYWDKDYNRITAPDDVWSPEFETELALRFIKNKNGERDNERPFALFLSFNPPHSPYNSRNDTDFSAYDSNYSKDIVSDPRALIKRENVTLDSEKFYENVRVYFSHVTGIDSLVGKLLDETEALDNTLTVFTADHGEMLGSHGLMSKNVPYEEATAIPFILSYPEKIKKKHDPLLIMGTDIMPTLLGLMGINAPSGVSGNDYSPILLGSSEERPVSAFFVQPSRKGVRTNRYLMTISKGDDSQYSSPSLFDLECDPYQMHKLEFDSIPKDELMLLRTELGRHLALSNDPWYKKRLYSDFIIYP